MTQQARKVKRVVVADDEPGVVDLITAMLAGAVGDYDLAIDIAETGERALSACRSDPPDALILDIRMPGIDGFETCRRLREDPRTSSIHIVMLTAFAQDSHMRRSFASGANVFLTKPFTVDQLVRALAPVV